MFGDPDPFPVNDLLGGHSVFPAYQRKKMIGGTVEFFCTLLHGKRRTPPVLDPMFDFAEDPGIRRVGSGKDMTAEAPDQIMPSFT